MKKDVLIYFDLITSLKTTQEVEDFIYDVDNFMLMFFKPGKMPVDKALDSISIDFTKNIKQVFTKNNLDINDRDTVASFFNTLKGLLKKFKVIKLVLASCPTNKTIERLHNFVKDTLGVGYILDIEILDEVLGGAIVIFNGKYADFTLKRSIEETFKTKNKEIEMLMQ